MDLQYIGLGLLLIKKLCNLLQAEFIVNSADKEEINFTIEIP